MSRTRRVSKEDGTLEPFRERKVAEAITRALRAAGTEDRALADELAGVVVLFLDKYHGEAVPSVMDVEEMLCRVLEETGHPVAANRFRELQRDRRRLEEEVTVRYLPGLEAGDEPALATERVSSWDRGRLIRSLVRKTELPVSVAEEIAAAVESRLIRVDLKSVTPVLVHELVAHELLERGLEAPVPREQVYGVSRDALDSFVQAPDGDSIDRAVAGRILERWALSGVHGEESAEAHASGRIHIHGLDDPLKIERLVTPSSLLMDTVDAPIGDLLLTVRTRLAGIRDHVREEVLLPDLVGALSDHPVAREDPERLCDLLLASLDFRDAFGKATTPRPHLVVPLGSTRGGGVTPFLRSLLARIQDQGEWLVVSLAVARGMELPNGEFLGETLSLIAGRPGTSLHIRRKHDAPLYPEEGPLPVPLNLSLGRIALNLPLAFVDARGCGLKEVLSDLDGVCRATLAAFQERFWHQRGGSRHGIHGIVVRLGGPGQVQVHAQGQEVDLEVWGLGQALEMLVQREVIHPSQRPKAAARILGYLDYLLSEESRGVQFRVRLGGVEDRGIRRRLLLALERHAERYGVVDVQEMLRDERLQDRASLPVVVPLLSERNGPLLSAPFAERMGPGLALPLAAFGADDPAALLKRLRDETRLGVLTLSASRPGEDVFEVQEELFV